MSVQICLHLQDKLDFRSWILENLNKRFVGVNYPSVLTWKVDKDKNDIVLGWKGAM